MCYWLGLFCTTSQEEASFQALAKYSEKGCRATQVMLYIGAEVLRIIGEIQPSIKRPYFIHGKYLQCYLEQALVNIASAAYFGIESLALILG